MSTLVLHDTKKNDTKKVKVDDKRADLAGPGIGDYKELEKILPQSYRSLLTPKETQQAIFQIEALHRRQPVQGTQPDDGRSAADRRRGERRQRHARPRRLAHAHPVPYLQRPQRASHRCPGRAGRHQVEEEWPSNNSIARSARASAPTCAPSARTISSTTTTAPTSTSGTGSAS